MNSHNTNLAKEQLNSVKSTSQNFDLKIAESLLIFKTFVDNIVSEENQFFSTFFLKLRFIEERYKIDSKLIKYLLSSKNFLSIKVKPDKFNSELFYNKFYDAISYFVGLIEDRDRDTISLSKVFDVIELFTDTDIINKESFKNLIILEIKENYITCQFNESDIKITIDNSWNKVLKYAWKGALINAFNLINEGSGNFRTSQKSLIVLEPNVLFDITDVAECFSTSQYNPNLSILRRFSSNKGSYGTLLGNCVNGIFDELIVNPEISFEDSYNLTVKSKPYSMFFQMLNDNKLEQNLKTDLMKHFLNLQKLIGQFSCTTNSLEPSFISIDYGLQGRLDLLYENTEDNSEKNILELKSGKEPNLNNSLFINEKRVTTGLWPSNLAQVTGYNLLLDSVFDKRHGISSILYSSTQTAPIRNASNDYNLKRFFIDCRNELVSIDYHLTNSFFKTFKEVVLNLNSSYENEQVPVYHRQNIIDLFSILSLENNLFKKWFAVQCRFIIREIYTNHENNFASADSRIFLESLEDKVNSYSIIRNLSLDYKSSDFQHYHLCFNKNHLNEISLFRKGDQVVLYQKDDDNNINQKQILKGSLKSITNETVTISLRNKLINQSVFEDLHNWFIEFDRNDSLNKKYFKSVMKFIKSDKEKINIILGLSEPKFDKEIEFYDGELTENQNEVVRCAVGLKDYFLIQGPPGTGKTNYILKNIVKYFIQTSDIKILLLAYTNRAVEEICNVLRRIDGLDFLRFGSKDSIESTENSFTHLLNDNPINESIDRFLNTRIFVATSSFILANEDIMESMKFQLAIIDEASQILEPQIVGILSKVDKFIMIGDEKQLPAVVTQNANFLKVEDSDLNEIELKNLGTSLFERLLRVCIKNDWNNAYKMLFHQGRMHEDIQSFSNQIFYGNQLNILLDRQSNLLQYLDLSELHVGFGSRVVFINVPNDEHHKVNLFEVKIIKTIIDKILQKIENFNHKSIGVISTFRAQCSEIVKAIGDDLNKQITVDTVERFQGSERDIIILSFATNYIYFLDKITSKTHFGEIEVDRKLNVALTRAKEMIIILGNEEILSKDRIYSKLITFIKENHSFIDAFD